MAFRSLRNTDDGQSQSCSRDWEQVLKADIDHDRAGGRTTDECTNTSTGGYKAKKSPALLTRVDIGHEAPKDGDHEQIENAKPDKKYPSEPNVVATTINVSREKEPEDQNV